MMSFIGGVICVTVQNRQGSSYKARPILKTYFQRRSPRRVRTSSNLAASLIEREIVRERNAFTATHGNDTP
jgi:hypothetical protein